MAATPSLGARLRRVARLVGRHLWLGLIEVGRSAGAPEVPSVYPPAIKQPRSDRTPSPRS
ncbi:hypothetical protein AB0B57_30100 [Micromonospora sp. NPDC049101]|uniref:hypothetical protein n=1 Tax=unclassified Micromonospora TaxID=2617518 RepID=UPI0033D7F4F0